MSLRTIVATVVVIAGLTLLAGVGAGLEGARLMQRRGVARA